MANSKGGFLKLAVFCGAVGGGLFWNGLKRMRQSRKVIDTGSIPVASAPQGFVELQGFAWPINPAKSLLRAQDCVYYSVLIEEERGSGKNRKWVKVFFEESEAPFFLTDESGYSLIYPANAELEVRKTIIDWMQIESTDRGRINEVLLRKGVDMSSAEAGWLSRRAFRVSESIILAGAPLYAMGTFRTTAFTQEGDLRPSTGMRFFLDRIKKLKANPLSAQAVLDADRDGRISFEEWYHGFHKTAVEAAGGFKNEPIVIPKGMRDTNRCAGAMRHGPNNPLYLADCHQDELLHRIGRLNLLRVIGGAALLAAAVIFAYLEYTLLNL